jgi:UDP-glucuronate 4-epimerase
MKILITGTAGFIGFHLAKKLIDEGHEITGLDNINDYYDVRIKYARLMQAGIDQKKIEDGKILDSSVYPNYRFFKSDLENQTAVLNLFESEKFDVVVNLAAQAGVRYSIENPFIYVKSNVNGFINILEGCRQNNVQNLIYASTSSVYGLNTKMPLSPHEPTEHPMTLYAATKKANEMMAHSYSHLYGLPTTGLRFFTVYGPWGRPDMALFLFTKAILAGEPINVFNKGEMVRDFTYVEDIAEAISRLCIKPAIENANWNGSSPDSATSSCPYRIFNIGNSNPIKLIDYINALESSLQKKAIMNLMPMQLGDVPKTHADSIDLNEWIDFCPETSVQDGIQKFVNWYKEYYKY